MATSITDVPVGDFPAGLATDTELAVVSDAVATAQTTAGNAATAASSAQAAADNAATAASSAATAAAAAQTTADDAATAAAAATQPTRLSHNTPVTIQSGTTVTVDLERPAEDVTVTAAEVLPTIAILSGGEVEVVVQNVTQTRTIVAAIDIRTLTGPGLVVDTARALTIGSGTALDIDAGDLVRVTVTMDGSAAPGPLAGVPAAQISLSLLATPRSA